jgi:hypothetical protein
LSFEEDADSFKWTCDNCGLDADFASIADFYRCVGELKARGWQFSKDRDGYWGHLCSKCRPKKTSTVEFLNRKPERVNER